MEFLHIYVKYLPRMHDESKHSSFAYVARDRVILYIIAQIRNNTTKQDVTEFLKYVVRHLQKTLSRSEVSKIAMNKIKP